MKRARGNTELVVEEEEKEEEDDVGNKASAENGNKANNTDKILRCLFQNADMLLLKVLFFLWV